MLRLTPNRGVLTVQIFLGFFMWVLLFSSPVAEAVTLKEIRDRGTLRHLGIPYANFITGQQDGLDVDLIRLFAIQLGVQYEFVQTDWSTMIPDLLGRDIRYQNGANKGFGHARIRGDLIANGFTIFPWRSEIVLFSTPTFPTQVWLVTNANSPLLPIVPTDSLEKDILAVRQQMKGKRILGKKYTCTDPALYNLQEVGSIEIASSMNLNMLAPAILRNEADAALLDVPDALVALNKWPGQLKVIGPLSSEQRMGVAFAPDSEELRNSFNQFFNRCLLDGTYEVLVRKYYPDAITYFHSYFAKILNAPTP